MNRLPRSNRCRVCNLDLLRLWENLGPAADRTDLARQINNGMCDECQRRRQAAAVEYLRAADQVRHVARMFAAAGQRAPSSYQGLMLELRMRVAAAEKKCVELKLWRANATIPGRPREM